MRKFPSPSVCQGIPAQINASASVARTDQVHSGPPIKVYAKPLQLRTGSVSQKPTECRIFTNTALNLHIYSMTTTTLTRYTESRWVGSRGCLAYESILGVASE